IYKFASIKSITIGGMTRPQTIYQDIRRAARAFHTKPSIFQRTTKALVLLLLRSMKTNGVAIWCAFMILNLVMHQVKFCTMIGLPALDSVEKEMNLKKLRNWSF